MKEMINFVICDDDSTQLMLLEKIIMNNFSEFEYHVIKGYDSQHIMERIKGKKVDVALLDVEMPKADGIDLGRKIKEENEDAIIVYITGFEKYGYKSFEVKAFDYIIKPLTEQKIINMAHDIKHRFAQIKLFNENNKKFVIKAKTGQDAFRYDDIYYFEKVVRQMNLHLIDQVKPFNMAMAGLLEEIDLSCFIQCHQSFVVNKYKISAIRKNEIVLKDGKGIIPLSRKHKPEVVDAFNKMIFD